MSRRALVFFALLFGAMMLTVVGAIDAEEGTRQTALERLAREQLEAPLAVEEALRDVALQVLQLAELPRDAEKRVADLLQAARVPSGAVYVWGSVVYSRAKSSQRRLDQHLILYLKSMRGTQPDAWQAVGAAVKQEECSKQKRGTGYCFREVLVIRGPIQSDAWAGHTLTSKKRRDMDRCGFHSAIWELRIPHHQKPEDTKRDGLDPPFGLEPPSRGLDPPFGLEPPPHPGPPDQADPEVFEIWSTQISVHPVGPDVKEARGFSFPNIVAVGDDNSFYCSGVLITNETVLTARHCLPATRVLFGSNVTTPVSVASVSRSVVPPNPQVDAALLFLMVPQKVSPRGTRNARETTEPLGLIRLMGFGANDYRGGRGFGRKRMVDLQVAGWGCNAVTARTTGCVPGLEMVVPRSNGRDTCEGDSGGPLFEYHRDDWRLLAITSRAIPGQQVQCGQGGIYVRVDALRPWIDSQLDGSSSD